jgi:hypothetical protein
MISVETHDLGCDVLLLVPGVRLTPPVPVNRLPGFLRSGFLGFFGVLGGSSFGAVLLAAVLSELPAFSLDVELGTVLAGLFIFPAILTERTLDKDLLALESQLSEVFGAGAPDLHVGKRGDLALFIIDRVGLIDAEGEIGNRGAFRRETDFRIVDQVTDDFDVVEDHNLIRCMDVCLRIER